MKKKLLLGYLGITLTVCLLPFAGMIWNESQESGENRKLASFPALRNETGWNSAFLSEAGEWFEDHFAYRQEMVTADALLRGKLFGVSVENGVIAGTDGWLYYKDSLNDYLGQNVLSDRAVYNIAHSLRMMQDYVERGERKFIFTIAPNKNSLYNTNMPYYYKGKISEIHTADKLKEMLKAENVSYVDLYTVFEEQEDVLYHKRDSHWDNRGASLAAEALLQETGRNARSFEEEPFEVRTDYEGDLDKMLYPGAVTLEEEYYFTEPYAYTYVNEVESNFDPEIQTVNEAETGSLLMYRDSFGNALLPFMAEEFGNARFSRGVPYYLDDMLFCGADTVIVERAERFLPDMGKNPPVAQAPLTFLKETPEKPDDEENHAVCQTSEEGLYLKFTGWIDETYVEPTARIYLQIDGEFMYEAFPATVEMADTLSDYGYVAYIEKEKLDGDAGKAELFVVTEDSAVCVYADKVSFS